MRYYPVLLDVRDQRCIIVGAGAVGERKAVTLLNCRAKVELIGKILSSTLADLVKEHRVKYLGNQYNDFYLEEAFLVIAATDDSALNYRIAEDARRRGILYNTVDRPDLCSFIVPSIINRGDLIVAFSTSGKSPAFAKKLRMEFEEVFGKEYEVFLDLMGRIRERVLCKSQDSSKNRKIFEQLVYSPVLGWIKKGDVESLDNLLINLLGEEYSLKELGITVR